MTLQGFPKLDPRTTPFRGDVAAGWLRGQVHAARYVTPVAAHVSVPVAPMRKAPDVIATQVSEAVFGETVRVIDRAAGWAWVQHAGDGYMGYVNAAHISDGAAPTPTHQIDVVRTPIFSGPSLKTPTQGNLSFGSLVAVVEQQGQYVQISTGQWLYAPHLRAMGAPPGDDVVAVAEQFLQTPYQWGGRSGHGTDCSGLVQQAFARCGLALPRDSDMQQAALAVTGALMQHPRRGDVLFWPGHVALAWDETSILHANAHHMRVTIDPLDAVVLRAGPLQAICRVDLGVSALAPLGRQGVQRG